MGEAKRRKKLDPNFGKTKIQSEPQPGKQPKDQSQQPSKTQPQQQPKTESQSEPKTPPKQQSENEDDDSLFQEWLALSQKKVIGGTYEHMCHELKGIKLIKQMRENKGNALSVFDEARIVLYSALQNKQEGKASEEEIRERIKKAGEMLYQNEGISALRDPLLWSFIPKPFKEEIELIWDDIK